MKFKFRMESILKLRKHQEQLEKQQLAEIMSRKKDLRERRKFHEEKIKQSGDIMTDDGYRSLDLSVIRAQYAFKQDQHQEMWRLDGKLKEVEAKAEFQRKKLVDANQRMRMLEKMKDREKLRFMKKLQHLEQKELNEIATQHYNREY